MGSDEVIAKLKKEKFELEEKLKKEKSENNNFISYLVKSNADDRMAFQNKINQMKDEENKRASEQQKIINSHNKKIQDLQKKNNMLETQKNIETEDLNKTINKLMMKQRYTDEIIIQYKNRLKNQENESKKIIEELNNKIKNESDEKKKKESIEKAEIMRVQRLLIKERNDLENKKLIIICKYFEENLSQSFCIRDFNYLIQRKADNLIKYLFIGE